MGTSINGPGKRKFTDRDVLRCFNEENRRNVGKIELSSKEITEILNQSVLDGEEVTRQAVKNRLDEMVGDELVRNQHGRSHLYSRSNDLDRLFREPEPTTAGPAPSGGGPGDGRPPKQETYEVPQRKDSSTGRWGVSGRDLPGVLIMMGVMFATAFVGYKLLVEVHQNFEDEPSVKRAVWAGLTGGFFVGLIGVGVTIVLQITTLSDPTAAELLGYGSALAAYTAVVLERGGFIGTPGKIAEQVVNALFPATT